MKIYKRNIHMSFDQKVTFPKILLHSRVGSCVTCQPIKPRFQFNLVAKWFNPARSPIMQYEIRINEIDYSSPVMF